MTPQRIKFRRIFGKSRCTKIECSRIDFNGRIGIMLRDVLRYPYVFEKSVKAKKCFFYRYLQLSPRGIFLKMLPEGATLWVIIAPVLGHL